MLAHPRFCLAFAQDDKGFAFFLSFSIGCGSGEASRVILYLLVKVPAFAGMTWFAGFVLVNCFCGVRTHRQVGGLIRYAFAFWVTKCLRCFLVF